MNDVPPDDNELTHADLAPVWDAICAAYPLVVEHITGSTHHNAIGLEQCIRVFHAEAVRLQAPIRTDLLLAMFARWPDGAFADRVGTGLFAKDIGDLWQRCIDELREKRRKEAETAAEAASWLTISDDPWDEDALPPRPWLAPPHLMRGEITLLHGPGAAGKSQLLISWFVALALVSRVAIADQKT